jgi:hypothetical protein
MDGAINSSDTHSPWNNGKLAGQKAPLRPKDIWAIRVRLWLAERTRELVMLAFDMFRPIDSTSVAAIWTLFNGTMTCRITGFW